jgi:hypothetical protein
MTEATAAAADRQKREKEEILDHNSPQYLYSSLSLSLSLSSPQKHKKNKRRKGK